MTFFNSKYLLLTLAGIFLMLVCINYSPAMNGSDSETTYYFDEGDFGYGVLSSNPNTVALKEYRGSEKDLVLSSVVEHDGKEYTLTEISSMFNCTSIDTIYLPHTITNIYVGLTGYCCTILDSIMVSDENETYCSKDGVLFNKDCTTLVAYPSGSSRDTYIVPDGVTEISSAAFFFTHLTSLTLPDGLKKVSPFGVYYAPSLESIYIPASANELTMGIVAQNLNNIVVDPANEKYASIDNVLYEIDSSGNPIVLICYAGSNDDVFFDLPPTVTTIEDMAFIPAQFGKIKINSTFNAYSNIFNWSPSLKIVEISSAVTNIDALWFLGNNLSEIIVDPNNANYTSVDGVLFNKEMTELICYPGGKLDSSYTVPDSVNEIDRCAFATAYNLELLRLGSSIVEDSRFSIYGYDVRFYSDEGHNDEITWPLTGDVYVDVEIEEITLNLNPNGGELPSGVSNTIVCQYREIIQLPVPTREGHVFSGWWFVYPGIGFEVPYDFAFSIGGVGSIELFAKWSVSSAVVTLNSNEGVLAQGDSSTLNVEYGSPYGNLPIPTREGYEFLGWYTEKDGGTRISFETIVSSYDSTIYAHWSPKEYTVTYMVDGMEFIEQQYLFDNLILLPATNPAKESTVDKVFTFSKWNGYSVGMKVTGNVTFTAEFTESARMYKVVFMSEGKVFETSEQAYGAAVRLPVSNPAKASDASNNYVFQKWAGYTSGMKVSGEHTFTAEFKAVEIVYTVTYMSEGKVFAEQQYASDDPIVLPGTPPVKESTVDRVFTFSKWNGYSAGMKVTGNVTFTAEFTESARMYEVVWKNGEEVLKTEELAHGTVIVAPSENPVSPGADFSGWNGFTDGMTVSGNHVFTAMFGPTSFNVSFINGGDVVKEMELVPGSPIVMPDDPVREGYVFVGWNPSVPEIMPSEDITFVAQWDVVSGDDEDIPEIDMVTIIACAVAAVVVVAVAAVLLLKGKS